MDSLSVKIRIVLTICYLALLMLLSLIPGHYKPGDSVFIWVAANTRPSIQKVLHVCFYGVLALLVAWTLEGIQPRIYRFLIAFVIAVAFGAAMEWCQTRVPGRYGALSDVGLNAAGAVFGLLAAAIWL